MAINFHSFRSLLSFYILFSVASASFASAATRDISTFGARCNGSDDTDAIQAALNATQNGDTLTFSCRSGIRQVEIANRSNITLAGSNGGGVLLLTQTGERWSRGVLVKNCTSCAIRDLIFEGNNKDMVPFAIEESHNSTISGVTIQNVGNAGCALLGLHNDGNSYLNNTLKNVGLGLDPNHNDVARGLWVGNVSNELKETNVTISGNSFTDIAGTSIAAHGSGITVTNNTASKINFSCVKALPLGGSGSTLIANNHCSGVGARYVMGGAGMMTEYPNSSNEVTVIRDNYIEGFDANDLARLGEISSSVGIGIANSAQLMSHNVQILNNTIRNFVYDAIQISSPIDNLLIEGNKIERTVTPGNQYGGIAFQGDSGKRYTNVVVRRNWIQGKFDGINLGGNGGSIDGISLQNNSIVGMKRDGLHIEVLNGGNISNVGMTGNCFSNISNQTIWDNRSNGLSPAASSVSCLDPTGIAVTPTPTATPTSTPTSIPTPTPTSQPSCTSAQFISGSVLPATVVPGGAFEMRCNYGAVANSIYAEPGSGTCNYTRFEGTTAVYSCIAGTVQGTFANKCHIRDMDPSHFCDQLNGAPSLTVQLVSVDRLAPAVSTNVKFEWK